MRPAFLQKEGLGLLIRRSGPGSSFPSERFKNQIIRPPGLRLIQTQLEFPLYGSAGEYSFLAPQTKI